MTANSSAYQAGLRPYDVIVAFNGKKIETGEQFVQARSPTRRSAARRRSIVLRQGRQDGAEGADHGPEPETPVTRPPRDRLRRGARGRRRAGGRRSPADRRRRRSTISWWSRRTSAPRRSTATSRSTSASRSATSRITLNAVDLDVYWAEIVQPGGRLVFPAVTTDPAAQTAAFTLPARLLPGTIKLHVRYGGKLRTDGRGFYLARSYGRKYALSRMEATGARRAFPSFDEPGFTASFAISAVIDDRLTAISNGKLLSDTPGPTVRQAHASLRHDAPDVVVPGRARRRRVPVPGARGRRHPASRLHGPRADWPQARRPRRPRTGLPRGEPLLHAPIPVQEARPGGRCPAAPKAQPVSPARSSATKRILADPDERSGSGAGEGGARHCARSGPPVAGRRRLDHVVGRSLARGGARRVGGAEGPRHMAAAVATGGVERGGDARRDERRRAPLDPTPARPGDHGRRNRGVVRRLGGRKGRGDLPHGRGMARARRVPGCAQRVRPIQGLRAGLRRGAVEPADGGVGAACRCAC